ncbi:hypothetical protein ACFQFG_18550 [Methylobacterium persicinum]
MRGGAGVVVRGNDRLTGSEAASQEALPGGTVSLNLVDVPLPVAAKAVLADTMGWGYTLDAAAGGTLTLQTGGPVARGTLLAMFEAALSSRGLVLRRRGRTAQILPAGGPPCSPCAAPGPRRARWWCPCAGSRRRRCRRSSRQSPPGRGAAGRPGT